MFLQGFEYFCALKGNSGNEHNSTTAKLKGQFQWKSFTVVGMAYVNHEMLGEDGSRIDDQSTSTKRIRQSYAQKLCSQEMQISTSTSSQVSTLKEWLIVGSSVERRKISLFSFEKFREELNVSGGLDKSRFSKLRRNWIMYSVETHNA